MEKVIKINAGNAKYISELKEFELGLPHGVVNKQKCDVGGTYLCMNCKTNYIVVAPFISLIESICSDSNNKYEVFPLYSGISRNRLLSYVSNNEIKKIAVTYDSFPKLLDWLEELGENLNEYRVLVDEYHLLIQQFNFRESSISELIKNVKRVPVYTFLTATPIDFEFEVPQLKELPHYSIEWENCRRIFPKLISTKNVTKTLTEFISKFLSKGTKEINSNGELEEVRELFIFLNSVNTIQQICDELELSNRVVKICCADTTLNRSTLGNLKISKVIDKNKKINFFTSKCFEGCNIFTDSGLIIVASDSNKEQTLLDIDTSLVQIAGRIRESSTIQNKFKNTIIHIFSSSNKLMSDSEFNDYMKKKKEQAKYLISGSQKLSKEEWKCYSDRLNITSDVVIRDELDKIVYSEMKEKYFLYKQKLKKEYSNNGILIREKYNKSDSFNTNIKENTFTPLDVQLLESSTDSFQRLINLYYSCDNDTKSYFDNEEIKTLLNNITSSSVMTLRYNKDSIIENNKKNDVMNKIFEEVYVEGFISCKELKEKFKTLFNKYKIKSSPKASLIEECKLYKAEYKIKKVNGKTVNGYILSK